MGFCELYRRQHGLHRVECYYLLLGVSPGYISFMYKWLSVINCAVGGGVADFLHLTFIYLDTLECLFVRSRYYLSVQETTQLQNCRHHCFGMRDFFPSELIIIEIPKSLTSDQMFGDFNHEMRKTLYASSVITSSTLAFLLEASWFSSSAFLLLAGPLATSVAAGAAGFFFFLIKPPRSLAFAVASAIRCF
jgi:hypothetical protein